jgi:hypothetical protein
MQLQNPSSNEHLLKPIPWPFSRVPVLDCYLLGAGTAAPAAVLLWLLAGLGMIMRQLGCSSFPPLAGVGLFSIGLLISSIILLVISVVVPFWCYCLFWMKDQKVYVTVYTLGWLSMLDYTFFEVFFEVYRSL